MNFLIIGAMKAGTTSLYHDLGTCSSLFLPETKEPDILIKEYTSTELAQKRARRLLLNKLPHQLTGEASTNYAKFPEYADIPSRAFDVYGPDVKIVYVLRNPIDRIESHYRHYKSAGICDFDFKQAIKTDRRFIDISKYDTQLSEWKSYFKTENILCIKFENYKENKEQTLRSVFQFIGVGSDEAEQAISDIVLDPTVHNSGKNRIVHNSQLTRAFAQSLLYSDYIKPLIPVKLRLLAKRLLTRRKPDLAVVVDDEDKAFINQHVTAEDWKLWENAK